MRSLFLLYAADLRDKEASQQVESTQLAAAEIERLAEDKQRLAEHLQQEVHALPHFFNPVFFFFFVIFFHGPQRTWNYRFCPTGTF